jgi:predicted CoA-binding protein
MIIVLIIMNADKDAHTDSEIRKFYELKNIAVVGMSKNEEKPAHFVPKYLMEHGYNIIPVNPTAPEVLGKKSYPSLTELPDNMNVDIVDVFRRSEDIPSVMDDVIKNKQKGTKVVWMQLGISNEEAERKAKENGIDVVYNRCMMEEHKRLFHQ